ncbi:MAG: aldolase catalytic domain-containing protein [Deltaproteobacteria bacterium]|nr:aldolase catalytic domain-containing protein [Deltaproteobacteria bacterium]
MSEMTVVDCTLRDGGFHNAWDFAPELVAAYLRAIDEAGVDYAEIGYRSIERAGFTGALRFTDEDTVCALPTTRTTQLGVMIDARELVGQEDLIARLFVPASETRVALVRVATRPKDLASALGQVERLHALGYRTGLNVMAWASVPEGERPALLAQLAAHPAVDVFYIADSYGALYPDDVSAIGRSIAELAVARAPAATKPWGIHLHDNLELAFANALAARKAGATWIDGSVLGMGRGPGNLKTELWLQHLESREHRARYRAGPLYELIGRRWEALHARYRWGSSAPYVLSGQLAVHPTYAQELLESQRYTVDEVTAILRSLHAAGHGRSFSRAALDEAMSSRPSPATDPVTGARTRPRAADEPTLAGWRGKDWSAREVLVVGRGPSAHAHADAINRYIRHARPIVVECNHLPEIGASEDHLAAFIVTANVQAMGAAALAAGKALLIGTASGRAGEHAADAISDARDGGGVVMREPYRIQSGALAHTPCTIPADVVSMFAIAQALRFGARRISVVGFDGYGGSMVSREKRMQEELVEFLGLLARHFPDVALVSLTPTTFGIPTRSIYGALALGGLA